jgi:hypothetical protein
VQSITSTLLPPSEFDTAELAIKRRAEKNVIGTLPFEAAAILGRRGLVMNDKNKVRSFNFVSFPVCLCFVFPSSSINV